MVIIEKYKFVFGKNMFLQLDLFKFSFFTLIMQCYTLIQMLSLYFTKFVDLCFKHTTQLNLLNLFKLE
jgi:hypothetical protein